MKLKFGDPIIVEWEDAWGKSTWDVPGTEGSLVRNIGFFILQNKKGLSMARGFDEADGPKPDVVLGPNFIPAACVRSIRKLR